MNYLKMLEDVVCEAKAPALTSSQAEVQKKRDEAWQARLKHADVVRRISDVEYNMKMLRINSGNSGLSARDAKAMKQQESRHKELSKQVPELEKAAKNSDRAFAAVNGGVGWEEMVLAGGEAEAKAKAQAQKIEQERS